MSGTSQNSSAKPVGHCGIFQLSSERGYALPSILFLITILSLLAAGIVSLVLIQHKQALREIAEVKAEYAAQSGIALELVKHVSGGNPARLGKQRHTFDDGSEATVEMMPWGVYHVIRSKGISGRSHSTRIALAACQPALPFQQALVFGNPSHQLVFAGTSSITGNVIVGQPGVTAGSLRNLRTPYKVPIMGTITKELSPSIPEFKTEGIQVEISSCRALLGEANLPGLTLSPGSNGELQLALVPDSIESVRIQGNVIFAGSIARRESPLRIAVGGTITLRRGASLRGLVCLFASEGITVSNGASIEHAILISRKSIELEPGSSILGQVVSPLIQIDSASVAKYPSAIVSFPIDSVGQGQKIQIRSGAHVEGLVALVGTTPSSPRDNILEIEPRAVVVGASYSENRTTLDGTVIGSVLTKDFYFYEAPTQYLGWVRNGVIDRSALPSGFLVPAQISGASPMDILDWL